MLLIAFCGKKEREASKQFQPVKHLHCAGHRLVLGSDNVESIDYHLFRNVKGTILKGETKPLFDFSKLGIEGFISCPILRVKVRENK